MLLDIIVIIYVRKNSYANYNSPSSAQGNLQHTSRPTSGQQAGNESSFELIADAVDTNNTEEKANELFDSIHDRYATKAETKELATVAAEINGKKLYLSEVICYKMLETIDNTTTDSENENQKTELSNKQAAEELCKKILVADEVKKTHKNIDLSQIASQVKQDINSYENRMIMSKGFEGQKELDQMFQNIEKQLHVTRKELFSSYSYRFAELDHLNWLAFEDIHTKQNDFKEALNSFELYKSQLLKKSDYKILV